MNIDEIIKLIKIQQDSITNLSEENLLLAQAINIMQNNNVKMQERIEHSEQVVLALFEKNNGELDKRTLN